MNLDKFASGGAVVPEPYIPTFKNPNIARISSNKKLKNKITMLVWKNYWDSKILF